MHSEAKEQGQLIVTQQAEVGSRRGLLDVSGVHISANTPRAALEATSWFGLLIGLSLHLYISSETDKRN